MAELERERDLVLNPNEFCFVSDTTKGLVNVVVGSYKFSMSNSDKIVRFDETSKRFVESSITDGIQKFISAPENWYVVLKNPSKDGRHPQTGTTNTLPELVVGKKINIKGPVTFSLFPGQMAKVIQGHTLRSDEYLVVRVYDAQPFGIDKIFDEDGKAVGEKPKYTNGQLLIVKGSETPFFIPETGMEVVANEDGTYIRKACVLDKLEYCVLRNERGEKKYLAGPSIVFPEADEEFEVNAETGTYKFKAIELSDISGIYIKVIADYADDWVGDVDADGNPIGVSEFHMAGEELFITGKDQKIYFPRPEHAIISYEGRVLHHAIAIPSGEGRYVLDRMTGDVKMVKGPTMYLPDPRFEVVVQRKLTKKECELWYPGNKEVLEYNVPNSILYTALDNIDNVDRARSVLTSAATFNTMTTSSLLVNSDTLNNGFLGQSNVAIEDSGFKRGNTYSKPRTITFDNKYEGAVSIDVWTGYAINVISKSGERKVIVGPQTYLLEYDETLEVIHSADGDTVFLRVDNDKVIGTVQVQTSDFVDIGIGVSFDFDFSKAMQEQWFSIEDYKNYLMEYETSIIRREVKKYTLEDFYNNASEIIRDVVLSEEVVMFDNGMHLVDCEVGEVKILNQYVADMLNRHQAEIVSKSLELSTANKELKVITELQGIKIKKIELEQQVAHKEIEVKCNTEAERLASESELQRLKEKEEKAQEEYKKALQPIKDAIQKAELARDKAESDATLAFQKEHDKLEADKQKAYTDAIKKVLDSVSPGLIEAINSSSKAEMLKEVAQSLSPYALASGEESVSDVVNKLMRGTQLEGLLNVVVDEPAEQ